MLLPGLLLVATSSLVNFNLVAEEQKSSPASPVQSPSLAISGFEIKGNTLLQAEFIDTTLEPFTGEGRGFADIQFAMEALKAAYRNQGFSTVQVYVPEQEIQNGVIALNVIEGGIRQVKVKGNNHHDEANILASLPALEAGKVPNAREISENLQLVNQNPSKTVDVVLSVESAEQEIDALVTVTDHDPLSFTLSADNTGSDETGKWRVSAGIRHDNLFNKDHSLSFNYTTSPEHPERVKQYSLSYRLPLYDLGDSVDFLVAKSDVSSGTNDTVFGPLNFSGKGDIYAMYYNHNFERQGEYSSSLTAGFDWRQYDNECTVLGVSCGSSSADVTSRPLGLTYSGTHASPGQQISFTLGYLHNIPGGSGGGDENYRAARPNNVIANAGASADYDLIRYRLDWLRILPQEWQLHVGLKGQYTSDALIPGEQIGLAGVWGVRGFKEREVARDRGYNVTLELFSPDLGHMLGMNDADLRALLFMDHARGEQVLMQGETDRNTVSLGSAGVGLRFNLARDITARLDIAQVIDAAGDQEEGDVLGHFSVNFIW